MQPIVLGTVYDRMEQYAKAIECYQNALAIRRKYHNGKNPAVADALTAIARSYEMQQEPAKAETYVKEALEMRRLCGDKESGMYIWTLHLLAEIYRQQMEFDRAMDVCKTATEITEKRFGRMHPRYAMTLGKQALITEAAGEVTEAIQMLETVAQIQKEMLDEDNPQYLYTLEQLARLYTKKEDYEAAIRLYREKNDVNFEETAEEVLGAAKNLLAIANCYKLAGNAEKAEAYFMEAEAKQKRCGLPEDETYSKRKRFYFADKLEEFVHKLKQEKNQEESTKESPEKEHTEEYQKEVEYQSALALSIRKKEGETRKYARVLLKVASLHAKLGHKRDMEILLNRVLEIEAKAGEETDGFGRVCDRAGRIFWQGGMKEKAEELLCRAYRILREAGKSMTREGHSLLLGLLKEKGDKKAYLSVKNGEFLKENS